MSQPLDGERSVSDVARGKKPWCHAGPEGWRHCDRRSCRRRFHLLERPWAQEGRSRAAAAAPT